MLHSEAEARFETVTYTYYEQLNGYQYLKQIDKGRRISLTAVFISDYGRPDRRLRVVYDNATESDLLLRSLQRALNKDKASRRITKPDCDFGPLFSHIEAEDDLPTGHIYVLRSQSDHPFIAENRSVIHKIGVRGLRKDKVPIKQGQL